MNKLRELWRENKVDCRFFAILYTVKLVAFTGISTTLEVDSPGYFVYGSLLAHQWVDETRTPVYPFLVSVLGDVSMGSFFLVTLFQFLISCLAAYALYQFLSRMNMRRWIVRTATVYFALSISVSVWENIILTESLSISAVVFYCYLLQSYLSKPRFRTILLAALLLLAMVFLRPTFLVFVAVTLVFLILHALTEKGSFRLAVASVVAVIGVVCVPIVIYMSAYAQLYGNVSLSNTLMSQQLAILIRGDLYQAGADPEIVADIDVLVAQAQADNTYQLENDLPELTISHAVKAKYGNERTSVFVNTAIKAQFWPYILNRVQVLTKSISLPFGRQPVFAVSVLTLPGLLINGLSYFLLSVIPFGLGIQVSGALLALVVWRIIKHKQVQYLWLGVSGYIAVIYAASVFGTCSDYARTAIAAVPLIIIGTAIIAEQLAIWMRKSNSPHESELGTIDQAQPRNRSNP